MEMIQHRWVNVPNMNTKGNLFGGAMLAWVDEDSSILAYDSVILKGEEDIELITAGMYESQFLKPVKLAARLVFHYAIAHIGNASMTIVARVRNEGELCFFGLIAFAGINSKGIPCKISNRLVQEINVEKLKLEPMWALVEDFKKVSKRGQYAYWL